MPWKFDSKHFKSLHITTQCTDRKNFFGARRNNTSFVGLSLSLGFWDESRHQWIVARGTQTTHIDHATTFHIQAIAFKHQALSRPTFRQRQDGTHTAILVANLHTHIRSHKQVAIGIKRHLPHCRIGRMRHIMQPIEALATRERAFAVNNARH